MNMNERLIYIISSLDNNLDNFISLLKNNGYDYKLTTSFPGAMELMDKKVADAILVDLDFHSTLFSEYCFSIKSNPKFKFVKIFFMSSEQNEAKELQAFNAGADDFIYKLSAPNVLFKRIDIRLSNTDKNKADQNNGSHTNKFLLDTESFTVYVNKIQIEVSKKEFELLQYMSSNPGKVFTRTEIFENVWKRKPNENERTLDVHILRLRKKLGDNFISTQKGVGYRFRP